jgi:hypothetical protein
MIDDVLVPHDLIEEDEARAEHARGALRDRLVSSGAGHARVHVVHGDPASRIVDLASEIGAGLIIVPSHSRTGVRRALLGSVAERVARFARCPVLIVPAGALAPTRPSAAAADDLTPEDQVDALGSELTRAVAMHSGYLTAARISVPEGRSSTWWQNRIDRRLADAGIVFVDLVVVPSEDVGSAEVVEMRFEEGFAE